MNKTSTNKNFHASIFYDKWMVDRAYLLVPAQAIVGEFLKTFKDFPPRAKAASFSIDQAMEKLMPSSPSK